MFVAHHGYIVKAIEIRKCLGVGLVFDKLFGATMQQTNVGISSHHRLKDTHSFILRILRPEDNILFKPRHQVPERDVTHRGLRGAVVQSSGLSCELISQQVLPCLY